MLNIVKLYNINKTKYLDGLKNRTDHKFLQINLGKLVFERTNAIAMFDN